MSELFGDWDKLESWLSRAPAQLKNAADKGNQRAGQVFVKKIREGIRSQAPGGQAFTPNAALTVALKGSTKALIDKGVLLRAVKSEKVSSSGVFVGVRRGTKVKKIDVADLASVHEKGRTIQVTEKMRRAFIAIAGKPLKQTTAFIRIPARPFLGPVFSDSNTCQEAYDEYVGAIKEGLKL